MCCIFSQKGLAGFGGYDIFGRFEKVNQPYNTGAS
jgi:hypothetical protein